MEKNTVSGKGAATGSMIFGIIAIVLWFFECTPILSVGCGITGLVLATKSKKEGFSSGSRMVGLVFSIDGLIGGAFYLVAERLNDIVLITFGIIIGLGILISIIVLFIKLPAYSAKCEKKRKEEELLVEQSQKEAERRQRERLAEAAFERNCEKLKSLPCFHEWEKAICDEIDYILDDFKKHISIGDMKYQHDYLNNIYFYYRYYFAISNSYICINRLQISVIDYKVIIEDIAILRRVINDIVSRELKQKKATNMDYSIKPYETWSRIDSSSYKDSDSCTLELRYIPPKTDYIKI